MWECCVLMCVGCCESKSFLCESITCFVWKRDRLVWMWVHFCECQSVFCVRALSECDKERPFCVNARAFCVNARSFNWTRESFMWMFCENASVLWENESIVCDCKYNIFECECSCGMRVRLWNASMVHGDVSMFCWDASACIHVKKKNSGGEECGSVFCGRWEFCENMTAFNWTWTSGRWSARWFCRNESISWNVSHESFFFFVCKCESVARFCENENLFYGKVKRSSARNWTGESVVQINTRKTHGEKMFYRGQTLQGAGKFALQATVRRRVTGKATLRVERQTEVRTGASSIWKKLRV